jgi:hypothetical protein
MSLTGPARAPGRYAGKGGRPTMTLTLDVPGGARATAEPAQLAIGTAPLAVRRRRGDVTLAVAARRATGSNRGRTDDPA